MLGGHHMSIVNSVMLSSFQMDSTCLEYYPPGECALQRVLRARADEEAAAAKRRKSASHVRAALLGVHGLQ